jgi:hypothetical protein
MAEFGNYGIAGRAAVFVGHPSGTGSISTKRAARATIAEARLRASYSTTTRGKP